MKSAYESLRRVSITRFGKSPRCFFEQASNPHTFRAEAVDFKAGTNDVSFSSMESALRTRVRREEDNVQWLTIVPYIEYSHNMRICPASDRVVGVPIRWTVRSLLERHGITAYRLMKESGLAQGTVYRLVKGDSKSLNAETLDRVMATLQRLTGEDLKVSDLLTYDEPKDEPS